MHVKLTIFFRRCHFFLNLKQTKTVEKTTIKFSFIGVQ